MRRLFALPIFAFLLFFRPAPLSAQWPDHWDSPFEGVCVLLDPATGRIESTSDSLALLRHSPCSTFKIPNSMIALERGIMKDTTTLLRWDGVKRWLPVWNQNHTLNTAFRNSVVWFYQKLARRIGSSSYRHWLAAFDYGNRDITGGLDRFWLESSLAISPLEQVRFLEKFWNNTLPVSPRTRDLTLDLMRHDGPGPSTLYGKTGSGRLSDSTDQGWFVGFVTGSFGTRIFAVYISGPKASGALARERAVAILRHRSLLP